MKHEPIEGLLLAQNIHIEESFSHLIDHDFDLVIELGTQHGGFTVFLSERFYTVATFDHTVYEKTLLKLVEYVNIDFIQMDIFKNVEVIERLIKANERVLLLCDNGNKIKEVNTFAKYLKPGDVIMAHDYARDKEHFETVIKPNYWQWHEISDKDVKDVFEENNISHYLQDEMEKSAWLCGIKN